ncbi:MAG: hypothetical protein EOO90_26140 [Pedobacter sp.]|nr:MAG: hypothetical protein EOO90_26140 [Pedobacter sp.]
MKKISLALTLLVAFASCKKNQVPEVAKAELSQDIPVGIIGFIKFTDPRPQGSAPYNFIGYGYDITDRYNDERSVRASIIDIPAFVAIYPTRFEIDPSSKAYDVNRSAIDAEDLARKLSNDFTLTSGLGVFRNTIKDAFTYSSHYNPLNREYIYGYYSRVIQQKRIKMNYNLNNYFLSVIFLNDVKVMSAAELVKKYGTHVLTDIRLGAKFNVIYQAVAKGLDREKISGAGLRYAINKGFGIFTADLDPIDLSALNANQNALIYYEATGGDLSKLTMGSYIKMPFFSIKDWQLTTTEDKAKFISIDKDGLISLEELIADVPKKTEVKEYIRKYILDHQVKLAN